MMVMMTTLRSGVGSRVNGLRFGEGSLIVSWVEWKTANEGAGREVA